MREADWACERVGGRETDRACEEGFDKECCPKKIHKKRGIFVLSMVAIFAGCKGAMVTTSLCLATDRPDACHVLCGLG